MAEAYPDNSIQPCKEEPSENFKQFPHYEDIEKQMQFRTRQAQRSDTEATIFLYGKSGAGKSATINYLFHTNIVPTSKFSSGTKAVTEYACFLRNSGVFKSELKMSFIDTPGFGETHGGEAQNLAKISQFIGSNPKFEDRENRTFPSIVLVTVSADDNRMAGINSNVSRMLHVLSKFKVVDRLHPNVVIVVTHAMCFLKAEYDENTKQIENICKALSRAHFSIEVPVVFIENLDRREEMEQEGDWKILPDGTRQPLNLFEAMIHLMRQTGDEVGVEAVRLLFRDPSGYEIKEELRGTAQDLPVLTKWKQYIDEIFFDSTENQIYSTLSEHIGVEDIQIFPLVYNLQKINLTKSIDLRTLNLSAIQQRIHPFQLTDEETDWLVHLFEVSRRKLDLNFSSLGLGYSRQFKEKRNRILEISPLKDVNSGNYSMEIPEFCSVKDLRQIAIDIKYVKKSKWVLMRYLKITFRICYVLFQVDIDDDKLKNFQINEEFIRSSEKSLLKGVDLDNLELKVGNPRFTKFVKDYALHCATGLYFGGYVKGKIYFNPKRDEETSERFLAGKSAELLTELESYFQLIQNGIRPKNASKIHAIISSDYEGCDLIWAGGNERYHSETFLNLTVGRWNNWINSIGKNIICLDKLINSIPLCTILSSSPNKKIRSYADFINTEAGKQTDLADQRFEGCLKITPLSILGKEPDIPIQEEQNILTRIEASDRVGAYCVLL